MRTVTNPWLYHSDLCQPERDEHLLMFRTGLYATFKGSRKSVSYAGW